MIQVPKGESWICGSVIIGIGLPRLFGILGGRLMVYRGLQQEAKITTGNK